MTLGIAREATVSLGVSVRRTFKKLGVFSRVTRATMGEKNGKQRQILGQELGIGQLRQKFKSIVLKLCGDCNEMED